VDCVLVIAREIWFLFVVGGNEMFWIWASRIRHKRKRNFIRGLVIKFYLFVDGLEWLSGTYLRTHTLRDEPSCLKGLVPRMCCKVLVFLVLSARESKTRRKKMDIGIEYSLFEFGFKCLDTRIS